MAGRSISLGGILFRDFEIPEEVNFGGGHMVRVHKLVGGARVVDTMGSDPDNIRWRGRFRGLSSVRRAKAVDAIRIAGRPVSLSYGGFYGLVVVTHFEGNYQGIQEVPYSIECTPVAELAGGGSGIASLASSITQLVTGDLSALSSIAARLA